MLDGARITTTLRVMPSARREDPCVCDAGRAGDAIDAVVEAEVAMDLKVETEVEEAQYREKEDVSGMAGSPPFVLVGDSSVAAAGRGGGGGRDAVRTGVDDGGTGTGTEGCDGFCDDLSRAVPDARIFGEDVFVVGVGAGRTGVGDGGSSRFFWECLVVAAGRGEKC